MANLYNIRNIFIKGSKLNGVERNDVLNIDSGTFDRNKIITTANLKQVANKLNNVVVDDILNTSESTFDQNNLVSIQSLKQTANKLNSEIDDWVVTKIENTKFYQLKNKSGDCLVINKYSTTDYYEIVVPEDDYNLINVVCFNSDVVKIPSMVRYKNEILNIKRVDLMVYTTFNTTTYQKSVSNPVKTKNLILPIGNMFLSMVACPVFENVIINPECEYAEIYQSRNVNYVDVSRCYQMTELQINDVAMSNKTVLGIVDLNFKMNQGNSYLNMIKQFQTLEFKINNLTTNVSFIDMSLNGAYYIAGQPDSNGYYTELYYNFKVKPNGGSSTIYNSAALKDCSNLLIPDKIINIDTNEKFTIDYSSGMAFYLKPDTILSKVIVSNDVQVTSDNDIHIYNVNTSDMSNLKFYDDVYTNNSGLIGINNGHLGIVKREFLIFNEGITPSGVEIVGNNLDVHDTTIKHYNSTLDLQKAAVNNVGIKYIRATAGSKLKIEDKNLTTLSSLDDYLYNFNPLEDSYIIVDNEVELLNFTSSNFIYTCEKNYDQTYTYHFVKL